MNTTLAYMIVVIVLCLLVVLWMAALYSMLVRASGACDEAWAAVDAERLIRFELLGKIILLVKSQGDPLREIHDKSVIARGKAIANDGSPGMVAIDDNAMAEQMRRLFDAVYAHKVLPAKAEYQELMQMLSACDERLQRAARKYNERARDLNRRCRRFPSRMLAQSFEISLRELYEVQPIQEGGF